MITLPILQIEPWIDHEELEQLKRVISSTFVVESALTAEFEGLTRTLTGSRHAVAVTNGTMALFCCLKALEIGQGDEVIIPDLTFIATANAVLMAGATPIFCDIDPRTFCIDPELLESLITPKTKAIMPVHLYGQSADMERIIAIASRHNLKIIEDAAQGVGVKFNGKHVGTFGDFGMLSYYGNKTITCGEGGVILTNHDHLKQICYRLKNHGRDKKGVFIHENVGYNFSFTEMQAAVGIAQMHKLERIIIKKKQIYERYMNELAALERFRPVFIDPRCSPVFWFTSFLTDDRDTLASYLLDQKIQTRVFFHPLHLQPCYKNILQGQRTFPVTEKIHGQGLSLPSSYGLTEEQQSLVITKIKEFYKNKFSAGEK